MNTNWLKSNVEDILNEVSSNTSSHDYFKYFAGTKESKISFEWFFKCLNLLEIHHDPDLVSREICLPPELVSYWYENAKQLGQLRSQKNNSRLFNFKNANPSNLTLKPAMIETTEELSAMTFFTIRFKNLSKKNLTKLNMS